MVVSPNPFRATNPTPNAYYVKFGDGAARKEYYRCNPDHAYSENISAPEKKLPYVDLNGDIDRRQPGKWLEWIHLKFTGMVEVYQRTEWHRLEVILDEDEDEDDSDEEMDEDNNEDEEEGARNDKEQLRLNLCRMLQLFPQWDRWYEDGTSDDPTSEFEELVDSTWWDHDDRGEAIARFVY
ncbi:hypothetical protein BJX66DRAFT_334913 [Aspergillus keveii]|uniref:Uncharacterized protein n=1 Tax=Aspergillus keveii TaxID=714993 RepID=A0ABR4GEX5_9EURO